MIRLTQKNEIFTMYAKKEYTQMEIIEILQKKGYEIISYLWQYKDTTFLGTTYHEKWTFTATKGDEPQGESNIYTTVFEKEVKKVLEFE